MIENSKFKIQNSKFWKIILFILLAVWLGFLYAQKIDLVTADLGRHLANGKWLAENHFNIFEKNSPIHKNFYSYTHPDFSVPNHHWGSGLIFYIIYKLSGFAGLSLFYIFLSLSAFFFFFWIACRESNFTLAALATFFLAPLMAERVEIRPEVWSVFFSAISLFLLWKYWRGEMSWKWLFALAPLQIFWVNLHVYFFLGFFLIGVFLFSEIAKIVFSRLSDDEFGEGIKKTKIFLMFLALVGLCSLLNPFGVKGLIYPLQIFKNYGYTIVENKSVSFVENYGVINPNFFLIKALLILMVLSFFLLFLVNRKKFSVPFFLFAVFFGLMGWLAIRNFTLLGFFALPILVHNFQGAFGQKEGERNVAKENGMAVLYIVMAVIGAFSNCKYVDAHWQKAGIGLEPGAGGAAEFIRKENIQGPIFNNYDIGGYLIWNLPALSAEKKVFVDNRPEAYPDSFFSQIYKPMQENPDIFARVDEERNFNAIVFYRNDITPWGMNFLKVIKENQNWAKVFEDDYAVIYKKNSQIKNE